MVKVQVLWSEVIPGVRYTQTVVIRSNPAAQTEMGVPTVTQAPPKPPTGAHTIFLPMVVQGAEIVQIISMTYDSNLEKNR